MAPEIYAGSSYGVACDVFSLGLVFWMINALPHDCPKMGKGYGCTYLGQFLSRKLPRPRRATDLLSILLTQSKPQEVVLINKMLAPDPANRCPMNTVLQHIMKMAQHNQGIRIFY